MSQLDVSISFSHLCSLIFCFYIFIHYISIFIIQFWYNQELRFLDVEKPIERLEKLEGIVILKRVFNL